MLQSEVQGLLDGGGLLLFRDFLAPCPTKTVANDVDDPRNHPQVVNARNAVRQGKVRINAVQLRRRQPELIVHVMPS